VDDDDDVDDDNDDDDDDKSAHARPTITENSLPSNPRRADSRRFAPIRVDPRQVSRNRAIVSISRAKGRAIRASTSGRLARTRFRRQPWWLD